MQQRRWAAEESAKAIECYKAGQGTAEIVRSLRASGYQRDQVQVRALLRRALPNERRSLGQARAREYARRREEAHRLARSGMRTGEIAAAVGLSQKFIKLIVPRSERIDGFDFNFERWLRRVKPDFVIDPDPIVSAGKSVVDLENRECHWPIGVSERGECRFCASKSVESVRFEPYCAEHKKLAKWEPLHEVTEVSKIAGTKALRKYNSPLECSAIIPPLGTDRI